MITIITTHTMFIHYLVMYTIGAGSDAVLEE